MRFPKTVLFALMLAGCSKTDAPTAPPEPTVAAAAPTTAPTATPNPYMAQCGNPLPNIQEMYGFGIKVQLEPSVRKKILNANPLVRNASYCASVGFGGNFCETRIETDAGRVPCDHYMTGTAETGGPGPNWYQKVNGQLLRCPGDNLTGDAPNCYLKSENQYLLDVYAPGYYVACGGKGSNGSCGECILLEEEYDPPPSAIGTRRPGLCKTS
jgi:hypothetical protein